MGFLPKSSARRDRSVRQGKWVKCPLLVPGSSSAVRRALRSLRLRCVGLHPDCVRERCGAAGPPSVGDRARSRCPLVDPRRRLTVDLSKIVE